MIEERRKIEFAAGVVNGLRGVPLMLFGLALLISTFLNYAAELGAQRNYGKDLTFSLTFMLICIAFAVIAYPKIKNFYLNKYGQTKAKPHNFTDYLIYVAPALVYLFAGGALEPNYRVSPGMMVLLMALCVFVVWWADYRVVSNALLYLSAFSAASALLPWESIFLAVTVETDDHARGLFTRLLCSIIWGAMYVVMGAVDYWFMTKMLVPVVREEEVYESV